MTVYKKKDEHKAKIDFVIITTPFLDIGGMLVNSVLKSNVIAQHVVSDVGNKSKQNGTAGRQIYNKPFHIGAFYTRFCPMIYLFTQY